MSDFFQTGAIATLHRLGRTDVTRLEKELTAFAEETPIALVLPCHAKELGTKALKLMIRELKNVTYLKQIIVGVDQAGPREWKRARRFFAQLPQKPTLLWLHGPRLQRLYPDRGGALLPVLHLAQEVFGYISEDVEKYVGTLFDLGPAHVHEVVTFYTMYFRRPRGRHVLSVCHNLSCHLMGAQEIIAHLTSRLGIELGETTDDGRITLLTVECLCACEMAPMLQVDDRYEGHLTVEKVERLVDRLA